MRETARNCNCSNTCTTRLHSLDGLNLNNGPNRVPFRSANLAMFRCAFMGFSGVSFHRSPNGLVQVAVIVATILDFLRALLAKIDY